MKCRHHLYALVLVIYVGNLYSQQLAILKYDGGGDWYANPTAVPNLIKFSNENSNTAIDLKTRTVFVESQDLFNYPIVFMTGHGNVFLSKIASQNLRSYLLSGGFLHISDNYGMDPYIRREMKKVFPEHTFQEIPFDHPIYNQIYTLTGLPKIHEHDNKSAIGYGIIIDGRIVCFYDFESDLSDGWEDKDIHNDPEDIRLQALKMGTNIINYAFKH